MLPSVSPQFVMDRNYRSEAKAGGKKNPLRGGNHEVKFIVRKARWLVVADTAVYCVRCTSQDSISPVPSGIELD